MSVNYVQRFFLRAGHTAERVIFDYGYDLYVRTFDANGEAETGFCPIQIKATNRIKKVAGGAECVIVIERRDLELWRREASPVFLLLYDAQAEIGYWLDIQESFVNSVFTVERVSVRILAAQRFDDSTVRHIYRRKNGLLLQREEEHDSPD